MQVTNRQSFDAWVRCAEVRREALQYSGTPALLLLPRADVLADRPVGLDHHVVDRAGCAEPTGGDGLLDGVEQFAVLGRKRDRIAHARKIGPCIEMRRLTAPS